MQRLLRSTERLVKIKFISLFVFLLALSGQASAQTTTNPISYSPICAGAVFPVSFETEVFIVDYFVIELSNASGSFAAPVEIWAGLIGGFGSVNTSRNVTIPLGTPSGTGYRIRVNGLVAAASGNNGSNLTINSTAVPAQPANFTVSSANVCQGQSGVAYTVPAVAGAISYAWSYSGSGATFTNGTTRNPTISFSSTATSGTLSVYSVNVNGCLSNDDRSMTVTVGPLPTQPSVITPNRPTPCANSTGNTYTVTNVPGVTYNWSYDGAGATITAGHTTNSITVSYASAANGTWTVKPTNSCGDGPVRTLVEVLGSGVGPAQPVFTAGNAYPCRGTTGNVYTVAFVSGVTYAWSYSGTGGNITAGTNTNSITVSYTNGATSGSWTAIPSNTCGTGPGESFAVNIITTGVPTQPSVITPSTTSPCRTSTGNTYTVTNVPGVTYTWTYTGGTGATITDGAGTNSITVSYSSTATNGTWNVRPSNSCGNGAAASIRTLLVIISPGVPSQPTVITPNRVNPCVTSTGNTYTVINVAGIQYDWSYSGTGAAITAGDNTNSITVSYTAATNGTWTVTPSNSCGDGTPRTLAVVLTTSVPAQPDFTAGNAYPCRNTPGHIYTVAPITGVTSYAWSYSGSGGNITAGTGTNSITVNYTNGATSGNWTVIPSNTCGPGTGESFAVTILTGVPTAQPSVITASNTSPCRNSTGTTYTVTNVPGITYNWTYTGGTGATIASGAGTNSITVTYASATNGTWNVRPSNSCGNGAAATTRTLAVAFTTAAPAQPSVITASATACNNSSGTTYTVTNVAGVEYDWSYSGTGASITAGDNTNSITVSYTAASNGTWTVTPSNSCGNGTPRNLVVVLTTAVPPQPSVITPSNATPCRTSAGITYTVTNTGVSYTWSFSGTGALITLGSTTHSITVAYTAATDGIWTVTPSNACGLGTPSTLAVAFQSQGTWIGNSSTSWTQTANWGCGFMPTAATDVIIPSGVTFMPTVTGTATVRSITIQPSATLTNSAAGTLNIYGNYNNNGRYKDNGTTAFLGSLPQSINGVTDSLNNMTVNNAAGVTVNAQTYVKKYLTLTDGAVVTNDRLTVDIYFGAILGSGGGSLSGDVTLVRSIWSDKWHYISSPLSGKTVADWDTNIPVKFGVNANLYTYDETNPSNNRDIGWTAIGSTAVGITSMKGYSFYFPRFSYHTRFTMTGAYTHNQVYSTALTYTPSGTSAADGWHLVGNPYPSEIDWNAPGWNKAGLDNTVYFFDQANNRYAYYTGLPNPLGINGGSQYIPCMQGFYVKVSNASGGTLGMTKNVRSSMLNRDNWRTASEQSIIRLTASSGDFSDETIVRLYDDATENFDSHLDAHKLMNSGSNPNISTVLSNVDYSINTLPSKMHKKVIPVKLVAAVSGNYIIRANIEGFYTSTEVLLEDRLLATRQDLNVNPEYTARLIAGDTTSRFYLHFKNSDALTITDNTNSAASEDFIITSYQQNVSLDFPNQYSGKVNVSVIDAVGNSVYAIENGEVLSGKMTFSLPQLNTGVYLVKVQTQSGNKIQRVYLSR